MKPDFISDGKPSLKPSARWMILAAILSALAVGGVTFQYVFQFRRSAATAPNSAIDRSAITAVSALGYLKPEGEIIRVSAPTDPRGAGSRVAELLVEEGDAVKAGQVIAILDNVASYEAALRQAQEEVKVAQANLADVRAGAKTGELNAQAATIAQLQAEAQGQLSAQAQTIARLQAELENARVEYQRYQALFTEGAVTASQLDSKRLTLDTTQEQLNEARVNRSRIESSFQAQIQSAQATLDQIAEVRPTDIQVAEAEVDRALANVDKAAADLALTYIRTPQDGQILEIYTRPGEVVGDQGIAALGQTSQMNVVAEVYELDVNKVEIGQRATIMSHAFPEELHGTVTKIGLQINPQNVMSTDPTADVDRRIVEVNIRLDPDDSQRVSSFSNLQVNVVVDVE
jgi:HlyD family secretion protein